MMSANAPIPEPLAHPATVDAPGDMVDRNPRVSTRRLGVGLLIVGLCWTFAGNVGSTVLLQAKIELIQPDDKVFLYGLATALYALINTVSLFVWGVVSDQARTRFGRRIPFIVIGAVGGALGLLAMGLSQSVGLLIVAFILYGVVFSALPAALLATFPDRVPTLKRGTLSAVYGGGQVFGGAVGTIIASRFLSDPNPLYFAIAIVMALGGLLFVLVAPDHGNRDQPRARLDLRGLLDAFKFPRNAPDFYWAFAGRFLLLLGLYMVTNFSLYILTDYIKLSKTAAGNVIAISGLASLVTIVAGVLIAGPISDRIKRRKPPILVASGLFAVGVLVPLVFPTATGMIVSGAVCALGLGAFLSVDAALLADVLPSKESGGKDLGILNTANTVPQVIAPLTAAAIVNIAGYAPVFVVGFVVVVLGAISIFRIRSVR
jgi:MFS family permease